MKNADCVTLKYQYYHLIKSFLTFLHYTKQDIVYIS